MTKHTQAWWAMKALEKQNVPIVKKERHITQWFKCKDCRVAMEACCEFSIRCPKCKKVCSIPAPPPEVVLV